MNTLYIADVQCTLEEVDLGSHLYTYTNTCRLSCLAVQLSSSAEYENRQSYFSISM